MSGTSGDDSLTGTGGNDSIDGLAGNDTISGGAGNDTITGGTGADSLSGGDDADLFNLQDSFGNDTIIGGEGGTGDDTLNLAGITGALTITYSGDESGTITNGTDTISFSEIEHLVAGSGADTIDASASTGGVSIETADGHDLVTLGSGDDTLTGWGGYDTVYGEGGNDSISGTGWFEGGAGNDTLDFTTGPGPGAGNFNIAWGGAGDDLVLGADNQNEWLFLSDGNDTLSGGTSETWSGLYDWISGEQLTEGFTADLGAGTASWSTGTTSFSGIEAMDGSDYGDTLLGASWAETVTGGLGDDSIVGDGGADSLLGEEGDDTIEGGSGDDTLSGGDGSDAIQGGAGYDTIYGGAGDDYLSGGGDGAEIHGDAGDDTIWNGDLGGWVDGGSGSDLIYADQGDDTLFGGDDADTFEINNTWGDFGADIITGGEGGTDIDHLDFSYMDRSVDVTATGEEAGTATDGTSTLTYSEIEIFSLSDYDDTFDTRGFNTGATVDAGAGADQLLGGNGDDSLVGGAGSDTLSGYAGNDTLEGGDDADLFQITDDHDTDSILGGEGGTDSDTLAFFNWASTDGVSVTFSGAEAGSYDFIDAAASGEGSFAEIEAFIGTAYGDVFDASAETAGIELVAGAGSDTISGGSGADSIAAGDDADTIYIFDGFGNDTIDGGEGSGSSSDYDVIDLSAVTVPLTITYLSAEAGTISDGTHTITFSNIENVIASGADDTIIGAATDDSLAGQAGDDVLIGGAGQDTLDGGADADLFQLSDITNGEQIIGGETVITGTDDDTLDVSGLGQAVSVTYSGDESGTLVMGTDTLTFVEIENIVLSDYGDTLDGSASSTGVNINSGSGDDSILGGTGQDTLIGGAGADTLLGGSEADSLIGGVGDDILTGGSHDDVFTYTVGDGNDTIADFNTGNSGTLSDGNASNNDFIDLSAFYGNIWELQADQADDGILNQSNDGVGGVDYSGNSQFAGGSLTFTGASADGSFFTVENTGVVCFAEGTRIRTAQGDRLVQDLRPGDLVQTMDNGVQKLLWVGRRHLSQAQLADAPNLRPVWLRSEAIGADAPLIVSPQHCLLMHINGQEHLVRARHLALMPGADAVVMRASQPVTYYHLLFERHEILFSNGAPTESFYPGRFAIAALGLRERLSLAKLFPDLVHQPAEIAYGPRARDVAKRQSLPKTLGRMAYSQA